MVRRIPFPHDSRDTLPLKKPTQALAHKPNEARNVALVVGAAVVVGGIAYLLLRKSTTSAPTPAQPAPLPVTGGSPLPGGNSISQPSPPILQSPPLSSSWQPVLASNGTFAFQPGHHYRLSLPKAAFPSMVCSDIAALFQKPSHGPFTNIGMWDEMVGLPSDWPAGDTGTGRCRMDAVFGGAAPLNYNIGATGLLVYEVPGAAVQPVPPPASSPVQTQLPPISPPAQTATPPSQTLPGGSQVGFHLKTWKPADMSPTGSYTIFKPGYRYAVSLPAGYANSFAQAEQNFKTNGFGILADYNGTIPSFWPLDDKTDPSRWRFDLDFSQATAPFQWGFGSGVKAYIYA
jgi:hypothetical protein